MDYHKPPSFNHLSPALEKLRKDEMNIQNKYELIVEPKIINEQEL